jgi:hypothetical protein
MSTATTLCFSMDSSFSCPKGDSATSMPIESQEESIRSLNLSNGAGQDGRRSQVSAAFIRTAGGACILEN